MFIKQTVEFELKGLRDPLIFYEIVQFILLKLVIFMRKQKFPDKSSNELLSTSKNIAGGNVPRFPPTWPSHSQNITQTCNIFYTFWT